MVVLAVVLFSGVVWGESAAHFLETKAVYSVTQPLPLSAPRLSCGHGFCSWFIHHYKALFSGLHANMHSLASDAQNGLYEASFGSLVGRLVGNLT